MLKYNDIIQKLTVKQKIALLTDTHELISEDVSSLGIPSVSVAKLWDANLSYGKESIFPSPMSLANSWNDALFGEVCVRLAQLSAKKGANLFVLPKASAASSSYGSELSEDPCLSGKLVAGAVKAMSAKEIPICLQAPVFTDEDAKMLDKEPDFATLYSRGAMPFKKALGAGSVNAVLFSEKCEDKKYSAANDKLLQKSIPADFTKISKIDQGEQTSTELSKGNLLLGGSSSAIEIAYENYVRIHRSMQEGGATVQELQMTLKDGAAISEEMIDEALDKKLELAFFCKDHAHIADNGDIEAIAYEAAKESIVMLKNRQGNRQSALPLRKGERVCIIGDIIADGEEKTFVGFKEKLTDALDAVNVVGYARGYDINADRSEQLLKEASSIAEHADTVLLFLGLGKTREASLSDNYRLALPANQQALVHTLSLMKKKIIAIVCGEHLPSVEFDRRAAATLFAPLEGCAVAKALGEILIGKTNPSGKLAYAGYNDPDGDFREMQKTKKDGKRRIGPFVCYRYFDSSMQKSKYPFGYGISYSSVAYTSLSVSQKKITLSVQNTSNRECSEAVQIYVSKDKSAILRPIKELKACAKVKLGPRQRMQITLNLNDMGVYDIKKEAELCESGGYAIYAASSASNVRISKKAVISGDILTKTPYRLSDYIYTVSNIRSENYTMEAYCKPMNKKSKLKMAGIWLIALMIFADVIYGVGGLLMGIPFEKHILSVVIINAICLALSMLMIIIGAAKNKRKLLEAEMKEMKAAQELFRDVERINANALEDLFVHEFDMLYEKEAAPEEQIMQKDESTYTYMAVDTDLPTVARELEKFLEESGLSVSAETARAILSSMLTSRLLVVRTNQKSKYEKLVSALARFFGTEPHLDSFASYNGSNRTLYSNGTDSSPLMQAALCAAAEINKPTFFGVGDIKLEDAGKVIVPYVQYLTNPDADFSIEENGKTITLPSNIWFIISPYQSDSLDTIPAFVSNVAMVIDLDAKLCQEKAQKTPVKAITCHQMEALVYRSKKASEVVEELWKNIDTLESFVNERAPYHIGNKLCLQIECYMAVCQSAGGKLSEAIDGAVSAKLLPSILAILKGNASMVDIDLAQTFETIFGDENVTRCRSMIKNTVIGARPTQTAQSSAPKAQAPKAEEQTDTQGVMDNAE
ncbi:MAG: glycoside hydrolase family 3 C-terminal domain-containing protein [Clostridia bacterium]|nr:glycoside hydrolase family 3 C-terminal domain-containing protein [Clostridia bacterium]